MSCFNCQNCNGYYNNNEINITGILYIYIYQLKKYVKKCCLIKYYMGILNEIHYENKLLEVIKIKVPKYIKQDNNIFEVYEIKYNEYEKIKNFITNKGYCYITRLLIMNIISEDNYKIGTKSQIDKLKMNDDIIMKDVTNNIENIEYVYLIQDRTAVELKLNIYKIGMTKQENLNRFKTYPKGYKILLLIACNNSNNIENQIMYKFKLKYKQINNYGSEYFQGNYLDMVRDITELVIDE